jgi:phage-related baseplate assembly protein
VTDRIRTLTVILDRDTRDDDVQSTVDALLHIKGVARVELGKPVSLPEIIARQSAASEIREQILAILFPERKPRGRP